MKDIGVCDSKPDIYLPELATVLKVEPMTKWETFIELKLDSGKPLGHKPGQFIEVSIMGIGEAPISVSSSPTCGDSFEMVVRNVGNVSGAMHQLKAMNRVGIRGPYGKAFPVEEMKGKDILFVAGGIGLAIKESAPTVRVVGVSQDRGPAMVRTIEAGHLVDVVEEDTLADALAGGLGPENHHSVHLCSTLLDATFLVGEEEIASAMAFLHRDEGLTVEGGGAVGVAAIMSGRWSPSGPTVVVLSGGNVSKTTLDSVLSP